MFGIANCSFSVRSLLVYLFNTTGFFSQAPDFSFIIFIYKGLGRWQGLGRRFFTCCPRPEGTGAAVEPASGSVMCLPALTINVYTLLALICPALGGQIDYENLALRVGQKKAGQNEAGQIKGRPKLGQLQFFAQNNWTCSFVCKQLK